MTEPAIGMKFEDLPITFSEILINGEWQRKFKRQGTIRELLSVWDIENGDCETAQLLRHLRWAMGELNRYRGEEMTKGLFDFAERANRTEE